MRILTFLCLLFFGLASASAETVKLKPMPQQPEKMTKAQFEKLTKPVTIALPGKDDYLDLRMRVPKTWVARDASLLKNLQADSRVYGEIAWYDAPGEGKTARPFFTVRSVAMDHDITAKAWLIQYMFDHAYSLRALREHSFSNVEAIYVTYDQLVTYTTWARTIIMGPRVVIVEFHLPNSTWLRDKDLQLLTMRSLQFKGKDPTRIENLKAFAFLDIATFQYPESWELYRKIIRSPDYFRVALFNAAENQTPSVQINVQAARLAGAVEVRVMAEEEAKFLDSYNFQLRDRLPAPVFVPPGSLSKNIKTAVYNVGPKPRTREGQTVKPKITQEYWLTSFERNGVSYVASMLTPARQSVYQDWARGTRTYQIVIETLAGNLIGMKQPEKGPATTAIPYLE